MYQICLKGMAKRNTILLAVAWTMLAPFHLFISLSVAYRLNCFKVSFLGGFSPILHGDDHRQTPISCALCASMTRWEAETELLCGTNSLKFQGVHDIAE
jgi:hypothetical protein